FVVSCYCSHSRLFPLSLTTLFRSMWCPIGRCIVCHDYLERRAGLPQCCIHGLPDHGRTIICGDRDGDVHIRVHMRADAAMTTVRDRKSTRLNSSQQIITYALFCLT